MDIPYVRGRVATQAHVDLPEGTVEEEYARNGFFGRYAHLYRTHAPVGWSRIEGPLRPRAYDLRGALGEYGGGDWLSARAAILENEDVRLHAARLDAPMPYLFRNADADELLFVHAGAGRIETDFGPLPYEPGDYVTIPRGTSYRLSPTSPTQALVLEAFSEIDFPERGMLGQHALFDPAVVRVPSPEPSSAAGAARVTTGFGYRDAPSEPSRAPDADAREFELRIQREGEITKVFYPYDPLDVVGWKGTLSPRLLNVRDIRPVLSDRYHLPPSAHTTFVMRNAVVCTFLPRPLENGDPGALKVPFYHSNIDFDEVIFYHRGEFFSRAGIAPGMLTFHPQGIHHGPQKQAFARAEQAKRTEEVAVMLDTKRPLRAARAANACELADYWRSWQRNG